MRPTGAHSSSMYSRWACPGLRVSAYEGECAPFMHWMDRRRTLREKDEVAMIIFWNMKRAVSAFCRLMAFGMMLMPLCAFGDRFLDDDLNYNFVDGYSYRDVSTPRVYVHGLRNKSTTHITIPSTVVYEYYDYNDRDDDGHARIKHSTCTVTRIGESNSSNSGFYQCSSLVSVTIPNNVMSIGERAFYNCSLLTSVTMPQSGIADRLNSRFSGSDGVPVRHLTLDATVSAIHENAFENCKVLTMIVVDAENEHYFVSPMDGCLYDRDQTTLLCCPRDKTSIDIPYGVTKIANNAFAYCSNLVSVSMPVTLKTIGENAFLDCASLPSVAIPDSVTNIGNCAFGNCRMLYGVTIPSSVQTLSTSAFNNCDILWTEWYRTLADFAVNGRAFDLTQQAGDRAIADVTVSGDMSLDTFVLKEGKVYDSVLYIKNNADHAVRVTLPSGSGNMSFHYQTFKGATPLTLPAYSQSILTVTRVAGGSVGGNVFLVTREELETVQ